MVLLMSVDLMIRRKHKHHHEKEFIVSMRDSGGILLGTHS